VAASFQRSDHLALMGDVPFPAMEKAFSLSKKPFQCGAVHGDSVAARSTPGPFSARGIDLAQRVFPRVFG
jgi:hypothetical protein